MRRGAIALRPKRNFRNGTTSALTAGAALVLLALSARDLRAAQPGRFDSPGAAERYRGASRGFALAAVAVGVLAAIPILVAIL